MDVGAAARRPRRHKAGRLLRYAFVGALATAAHYTLLVIAVEAWHWPAWLGAGAGAVLGAQLGYAGNRWFTFGHRGAIGGSWPRFQATAAAGAVAGMAIVALGVRWGLHYLAAQVLATVAAMLLTYAINRRWTFGSTPAPE